MPECILMRRFDVTCETTGGHVVFASFFILIRTMTMFGTTALTTKNMKYEILDNARWTHGGGAAVHLRREVNSRREMT